ncbi:hypothetical protein [Acidovorax sp. Leaf160]|uniref:hypothetical protein n=1 Tax=Acidovorax sp. Leaf160 TaxID=1736280 RepID=UPI000AC569E1|nr:hypothetical protein [Acidovorax sp. Leaf160]
MPPSLRSLSLFRALWAAPLAAIAVGLTGCATAEPESAPAPPAAPAAIATQAAPPALAAAPAPEVVAEEAAAASPAATPPEPRPAPMVSQLLAYSVRVASLSGAELSAEIGRLTPLQDESIQRQLELALALGQTRQPVDTARALGLVQRALSQKGLTAGQQAFGRLLETRFLNTRRLEDLLDRQAQQLRDAQRRNDQLNERLEAMRAIERSLNARPGAPAAPAGRPATP